MPLGGGRKSTGNGNVGSVKVVGAGGIKPADQGRMSRGIMMVLSVAV